MRLKWRSRFVIGLWHVWGWCLQELGHKSRCVYSFSVLKRKIISRKEDNLSDKEFRRSAALIDLFSSNREGYLDKPPCHLYLPRISHDYDCPPKPVIVDIGKSKEGKMPIWPLFTCDCKCQSELGGKDSNMDLLAGFANIIQLRKRKPVQ